MTMADWIPFFISTMQTFSVKFKAAWSKDAYCSYLERTSSEVSCALELMLLALCYHFCAVLTGHMRLEYGSPCPCYGFTFRVSPQASVGSRHGAAASPSPKKAGGAATPSTPAGKRAAASAPGTPATPGLRTPGGGGSLLQRLKGGAATAMLSPSGGGGGDFGELQPVFLDN
jgi:hypothetical protein